MVKNPIKVYARLKPEKNRKGLMNYQILHRTRENVEEDIFLLVSPNPKSKDFPDNRPESWNFSFTRIFEEATTQEGIFQSVAQPVVDSALYGYNGTIFAYGQTQTATRVNLILITTTEIHHIRYRNAKTASGKTYSITGRLEVERRGIIPRCLQYLFDAMRKRPENVYSVEVAYLEIYNETGYDLLDRGKQRDLAVTKLEDLPRISLMEDETGRLHMKNLTFHAVTNVEEAFELLILGDNNRIVVETPMNSQSSRSHCIFTIVVSTKEFGADQYKRAKVHLVDLAGSERVYKCSITGTILTEAKHINLSLHYLEQVIVCLGQESAGHIPYRNSLLTSILRDSLGGNCLTTMLATLSLVSTNIEETLSTCRFAQRVALIRNDAKLNLETDIQNENALLKAENERLRQEIKELTSQNTPQDLTADDKRHLDTQIRIFLESNEQVSWDSNPKMVQYCFDSIKRIFELNKDPQSCMKRLEYYKDLVIQRDKEISLLIDMVKKAKGQRSTVTNDNPSPSDNIQDDKEESMGNRVCSRKQKRRPKHAKIVAPNQTGNDDRVTIISEKHSCSNVEDVKLNIPAKSPGRKSFIEQILTSRSISIDASTPSLSSCNIVNLTFNNSTDKQKKQTDRNVDTRLDERNQHSLRAREKREKTIETKNNVRYTESKDKPEDEINVSVESAKVSFTEIDYSIPVYQKFLSFNAKLPEKSFPVKEDRKTAKVCPVRKSSSEENCKQYDNLPLTGDPDIDEEIIAFYKAKRSGGAY